MRDAPIKAYSLMFATAVAFGTSGCGQQQKVEKRLSDVETRVTALEKASPLSSLLNRASPTPAVPTKSPLQLVSWEARLGRGQHNDYHYTISLTLKNNSNKDIKLVDASVQFADLLGLQIFAIRANPDGAVPAGQEVTQSGDYSVNEYMPEQLRLEQMKKEDIKATLIVRKLVFGDNSIGEYVP